MSFFDEFLRSQNAKMNPEDEGFDKKDWGAFVFALTQLRLAGRIIFEPESYEAVVPLLKPEAVAESLPFVFRFLCYFVVKPPQYAGQIAKFKSKFVPNFAADEALQQKLSQAMTPNFSTVPLEAAEWNDLAMYFKPEEAEAGKAFVTA